MYLHVNIVQNMTEKSKWNDYYDCIRVIIELTNFPIVFQSSKFSNIIDGTWAIDHWQLIYIPLISFQSELIFIWGTKANRDLTTIDF